MSSWRVNRRDPFILSNIIINWSKIEVKGPTAFPLQNHCWSEELNSRYFQSSMVMHIKWNHFLHPSHMMHFWFQWTGFVQTSQEENFQAGLQVAGLLPSPGFNSISPDIVSLDKLKVERELGYRLTLVAGKPFTCTLQRWRTYAHFDNTTWKLGLFLKL